MSTTPVSSKDAARLNELLQSYLAYREIGEDAHTQKALEIAFEQAFRLSLYCSSRQRNGFALRSPEAIQELRIATLEAITSWDPKRGSFISTLWWSVRDHLTQWQRRTTKEDVLGSRSKQPIPIVSVCAGQDTNWSHDLAPSNDSGSGNEGLYDKVVDPDWSRPTDLTTLRLDITEALSHLPPQQQEVVVQHFGLNGNEPRTYREIAAAKGQNHTNVCYHLRQALKTLRHELQAYA